MEYRPSFSRTFAAVSQIPDFPDAGVSPGLRGAPPAVVLRSLRTLGVVSCPLNLISLLGGGGLELLTGLILE